MWKALYDAAGRVRDLHPWDFMAEADTFGLVDAESGGLAAVNVMGMLGEYRAVAVYPEADRLRLLWDVLTPEGADGALELALGTNQLHLAFGGKGEVLPGEKELHRRLGLKFRGPIGWLLPRSRRTGYDDWYVDAAEARLLTVALDQLSGIAPRVKQQPHLLRSATGRGEVLVRTFAGGAWSDAPRPIPARTAPPPQPVLDLSAERALAQVELHLEMDLFPSGVRIGERGKRPLMAFMLLVVDAESAVVLGAEPLTAEGGWAAMWQSVAYGLVGNVRTSSPTNCPHWKPLATTS